MDTEVRRGGLFGEQQLSEIGQQLAGQFPAQIVPKGFLGR